MIRLIYGDNEFALTAERHKTVTSFLEQYDAFGFEYIDASESAEGRLREAVMQLPFLVERKLIVITGLFDSKNALDFLTQNLDAIPSDIDVLIITTKPDKRTKLYKTLQAQKSVTEFPVLSASQLTLWARNYALQLNAELSVNNAQLLVDRVGLSQMLLAREIEKLATEEEISAEAIQRMTEQHLTGTVFDLLSAVFSRKVNDALGIYDTLLSVKTDPAEIISLVAWQLHVFSVVSFARDKTNDNIARSAKLHPFVVSKATAAVRGISREQLSHAISLTIEAELRIKSQGASPEDTVRVLLLELSSL